MSRAFLPKVPAENSSSVLLVVIVVLLSTPCLNLQMCKKGHTQEL